MSAPNTVAGVTWSLFEMVIVHVSGAAGLLGIAVLFPYGIWRACRRIVRADLWEDEHEQAMYGNFYADFKPRYWWAITNVS